MGVRGNSSRENNKGWVDTQHKQFTLFIMVAIESNNVGHFDNGLTHSLRLCLEKIILSMRHKLPVSRSKLSKTMAVFSYQPNDNYRCTNLSFSQDMKDSLVGTYIKLSV